MSIERPTRDARTTTTIGFVSLGCPKNLVDSEVMLGTLAREGYRITPDKESADVIVVNTCGFIDTAKRESIDTILEMARLKDEGRCRRLVVAGCLAERYRDEIRREIPEIDFAFGPDELGRILEAVRIGPGPATSPPIQIDALYTSREVPTIPRMQITPRHMAYLKISEGCDHACSFCAIPGFRGRFRSRTPNDLVAEAERLREGGVRELTIVSQDTLAYGKDLGLGPRGLETLLDSLLDVDIDWIRFLYCYPNLLSPSLIARVADEPRLCSYFDIPYQHASPRVLERMKRGGGRQVFRRQVDQIRRMVPSAGIRTSFIVGFPGETDADFDELIAFVDEAGFDNLGVFVYSDEEGTAAFDLDGKVPREIAEGRRDRLMAGQADIVRERLSGWIGKRVRVLLDGFSSETDLLLEGRMETQAPEIDGRVLINDAGGVTPSSGEFYRVEITEALDYDLLGRIIEPL